MDEINQAAPINNDAMREDVCENCYHGRFKDTGPQGECRLNPKTVGVIVMPVRSALGQIEPQPTPWAMYPPIERREYCGAFEPV